MQAGEAVPCESGGFHIGRENRPITEKAPPCGAPTPSSSPPGTRGNRDLGEQGPGWGPARKEDSRGSRCRPPAATRGRPLGAVSSSRRRTPRSKRCGRKHVRSPSFGSARSFSSSVTPGMNSNTRKSTPSWVSKSCTVAMLGWFNSDSARASLRKRLRAASSANVPAGRTFTATSRLNRRSRARYTTPMPPWPSLASIR